VTSEKPHIAEPRRACEDGLEELPAIIRDSSEVDRQLAQNATLPDISGVSHQRTTQLPPARSLSHIDETLDSALAQSEYGMWRSELEFTEECDRRDTGEFANERRHTRRALARTAHGDQDGIDLLRLQVMDHIVNTLAM
jgi:hypothetical protein